MNGRELLQKLTTLVARHGDQLVFFNNPEFPDVPGAPSIIPMHAFRYQSKEDFKIEKSRPYKNPLQADDPWIVDMAKSEGISPEEMVQKLNEDKIKPPPDEECYSSVHMHQKEGVSEPIKASELMDAYIHARDHAESNQEDAWDDLPVTDALGWFYDEPWHYEADETDPACFVFGPTYMPDLDFLSHEIRQERNVSPGEATRDDLLHLVLHPDTDTRAKGLRMLNTLLDEGNPEALSVFEDSWLQENGRLTDTVAWNSELLECFFGHPKVQIHPNGKTASDVLALDLSPILDGLSSEGHRIQTLSWLKHLPSLRRLNLAALELTEEMIDQLLAHPRLEWLNTSLCLVSQGGQERLKALTESVPSSEVDAYIYFATRPAPSSPPPSSASVPEPETISVRTYRVGAAAIPIVIDNRIKRLYFVAEGYGGGGCQEECAVRVEFTEQDCKYIYAGFSLAPLHYENNAQLDPAINGEQAGYKIPDFAVPDVDRAIFQRLVEELSKYREYNEEGHALPTKEAWDQATDEEGCGPQWQSRIFRQGDFNTQLTMGLCNPILPFLTGWAIDLPVTDQLQREDTTWAWQAFEQGDLSGLSL